MKIFAASQIREWDEYTIRHEPIASLDLMNRAAGVFTTWFMHHYPDPLRPVVVFAGTGNNGGDGVAVARMLDMALYDAKVVVCDFHNRHSPDFNAQLSSIPPFSGASPLVFTSFQEIKKAAPELLTSDTVVIDALFGSGLNRPLTGEWEDLIDWLKALNLETVSIDVPSGLFIDEHTPGSAVIRATRSFSFQAPKRAFFFPENAERVGEWAYGGIGLHPDFEQQTETPFHYITPEDVAPFQKTRPRFSHKGSFGHALLIAGGWEKMGAAVLAARACLRAGVGLLTVHGPVCGYTVMQSAVPEAMFSADGDEKYWTQTPALAPYSAVGAGPGIGKEAATQSALKALLQAVKSPVVLDADALNILAENPEWFEFIPENSILTPHPKEFERLFGKSDNDFRRNDLLREMARKHKVYIVLKGAHTAVACPDGACWFNSSGNPGMAKGGSGDVLTGLITGLLARGYPPFAAVLCGVYFHGKAGDEAASVRGQGSMIAGDMVEYLRLYS